MKSGRGRSRCSNSSGGRHSAVHRYHKEDRTLTIPKTLEDAVLQEWEADARAHGLHFTRRNIVRECVELFVLTGGGFGPGDHPVWEAFKAEAREHLPRTG